MITQVTAYGGFPGMPEYLVPGEEGFFRMSICHCTDSGRNHAVKTIPPGIRTLLPCATELPDTQMVFLPRIGRFVALLVKDGEAQLIAEDDKVLLKSPLPSCSWPERYSLALKMAVLQEDPLRLGALLFSCVPMGHWGVLCAHRYTIVELQEGRCTVLSDVQTTNQNPSPFDMLTAHEGRLYAEAVNAETPWRIESAPQKPFALGAGFAADIKRCPLQTLGTLEIGGKVRLAMMRQMCPNDFTKHYLLYVLDDSGTWRMHDKIATLSNEQGLVVLTCPELLHSYPLGGKDGNNWESTAVCFYVNGGLFAALCNHKTRTTLGFWQMHI